MARQSEQPRRMRAEQEGTSPEPEASKEALQALNEDLTTVNAQLRAKVEEHQAASGEMASLLTSTDMAVLVLDTALRVRRYTPAFLGLVDGNSCDVGRPMATMARRFNDPHLDEDARAVLERPEPIEREVAAGDGRHFLRRVLPYRTTDDRTDGIVITFVDISGRERAGEAPRASEERLRLALESATMMWWELDVATGTSVVSANFADVFGFPADRRPTDAAAAIAALVLPEDAVALADALARTSRGEGDLYSEYRMTHPVSNEVLWIESTGTLVDGGDSGRARVVGVSRNVTDRKRAEAALRESERRLRLALTAARMGVWTLDVATGLQTRDDNLNGLLGLDPVGSTQPFAEFLDHIHPGDRAAVSASFEESVKRGRRLNLEFRVVRPDGAVRWLRDQGDVSGEPGDGARYLAGACVDVTERRAAEEAVRAGEERLRLILASATDYAIITQGTDLRITGWSPGAEAIFGYAEAEILGRPGHILFTPEDRAAGEPVAEASKALREGRAADERWHVRKDGSRFYASGVLTPMGDGATRGFVKVARDLTERKQMEDALRRARDELERRVAERTAALARANEALTELLRRVVDAQENERRRVARDLHDRLGQELTSLILGLKALEQAVPDDAPGRARLLEVEAIVGRIGREAHDLAIDLRPTVLDDLGLTPALSDYVANWSERTGIAVDFQPTGLDGHRLPPEVETTVYRVVQEALNNVAKHAGAGHVSVIVERGPGGLTALVEDDGRGFDPSRAGPGNGRRSLGLLGMRERVGLVNGELEVESGEGKGTTVRARIPLGKPAPQAGLGG